MFLFEKKIFLSINFQLQGKNLKKNENFLLFQFFKN